MLSGDARTRVCSRTKRKSVVFGQTLSHCVATHLSTPEMTSLSVPKASTSGWHRKDREDDAGLAGKVAIVSGGGAAGDGIGNGRAAAILLARAGARVVVADLDPGLAGRTVEMIEAEGGSAVAIGCDVTIEAECKRLVEAAIDRWGRLDFLDNN